MGGRRRAVPVAALLCAWLDPSSAVVSAPASAAGLFPLLNAPPAVSQVVVRDPARGEVWRIASLVEESFGACERSYVERAYNTARLAFDIERRLTPWHWSRHRQLVAEDGTGRLVGFIELWGEDDSTLGRDEAQSPQPCVFNLCVADDSRRQGVGRALLKRAEEHCAEWRQPTVYLKVAPNNEPARALYERAGYRTVGARESSNDLARWKTAWKGDAPTLLLQAKPVGSAAARLAAKVSPPELAPGFDELSVTLEKVLAYDDADALLWFALLMLRNARYLSPVYTVASATVAVAAAALTYAGLASLAGSGAAPALVPHLVPALLQ